MIEHQHPVTSSPNVTFQSVDAQLESEYVQTTSVFKESAAQEKLEPAIEPQFIPYEAAPVVADELSLEPTIIEYDIKEGK